MKELIEVRGLDLIEIGANYNPKIHKEWTKGSFTTKNEKGEEMVGILWKGTTEDKILFVVKLEVADELIKKFNEAKIKRDNDKSPLSLTQLDGIINLLKKTLVK